MTIRERIKILLSSLRTEDVILAAKLLTTVEGVDIQIAIFYECCTDKNISATNGFYHDMLVPARLYSKDIRSHHDEFHVLKGEGWYIIFVPDSRAYMTKRIPPVAHMDISYKETIIL